MKAPSALVLLLMIMTASWIILIAMTYLIFQVIVPISPPIHSPYSVVLAYAFLKLILAVASFGFWLYSYFLLRDMFIKVKGLNRSPTPSSSDRTEP